jgi:hypothetical protein
MENGYAIATDSGRQPLVLGKLSGTIARLISQCIIAGTKFLGNSAGSGVAVIWTISPTTWNIEEGSVRGF